MDVQRVPAGELTALGSLLAGHPHHDYRLYPRFSPEDRARVLARELEVGAGRGVIVGVRARGRPVGVLAVESLAWDSAFFGLPMGRLGVLVVDPGARRRDVLGALLDEAMEVASERGLQHLAARADTEDLEAVQALEARGFRLMDCLVT